MRLSASWPHQPAATFAIPWSPRWSFLLIIVGCVFVSIARGMSDDHLRSLREQTVDLFYHGFDNYMNHAFPEDELKPLSCGPLTRDVANPGHIELNDALGNYSLTLIDSLTTLTVLASSPEPFPNNRDPFHDFQKGIEQLVHQYGDGSIGPRGQGIRGRGFDLDSKVQVFETVIRGVGGLVSAHLFAIGELPIVSHSTSTKKRGLGSFWQQDKLGGGKLPWMGGFVYDGQLLRLALDLAKRLLPAFHTETGLPYPRVNLRHGVPFYLNSPLNIDSEHGTCERNPSGPAEITETCSAGAGSLILEFATLSRLTGDPEYEELAKRAFWAVWDRRSDIGLLGLGVDAETGLWVGSNTGIGAGIDSFFEYALKSHILFSASDDATPQNDTETFLTVWQDSHAGIKRHLYRGSSYQHPHYIQGDLFTGASKAFWIDSLSAYYPGLLALSGEVDEAIETHLLYTALWTRYSALPERWNSVTGTIDMGIRWWGGRPEFIESTWYLYRATEDPFYLYVGEMTLQDIQRRCWTACGWAGLEDVRTGELKDRMESFFLGETAKYLYLLFNPSHPLNHLDAPFVFTTEAHPLLLPESTRKSRNRRSPSEPPRMRRDLGETTQSAMCQAPASPLPFSVSGIGSRPDLFHAAGLAKLHQIGRTEDTPGPLNLVESSYDSVTYAEAVLRSPNNFTFYPWTLPPQYVPNNGTSAKMDLQETFDLVFPTMPGAPLGSLFVNRIESGVVINAISGLKLGMTREDDFSEDNDPQEAFRIHQVGQLLLGRDEKVLVNIDTVASLNTVDPYFTRKREVGVLDLILDLPREVTPTDQAILAMANASSKTGTGAVANSGLLKVLLNQFQNALDPDSLSPLGPLASLIQAAQKQFAGTGGAIVNEAKPTRPSIPASVATGPGAAPIPDVRDARFDLTNAVNDASDFWSRVYVVDGTNCDTTQPLPSSVPKRHQVIMLRRGDCSFSQKLRNIPSFAPSSSSLQLVILFSPPEEQEGQEGGLVRPLLDEPQMTPGGMKRVHGVPVVMVSGGEATWKALNEARGIGIRRRYWYESQGIRISNLLVL